jgi:hypothetical protein
VARNRIAPEEARMTVPPDFGGHEFEEGVLEDLGGPQEKHPVSHQDQPGYDFEDNELHAVGRVCARCGQVIRPGQDVRLHDAGQWMHESCPATS